MDDTLLSSLCRLFVELRRYSPVAVAAKIAVSYLLSSELAIDTTFAPSFSIVQSPVGIMDKPVWSQFIIRSFGISLSSNIS